MLHNHIVFFSSGKASWLAAKRVAEKFGVDRLWLVFADTTIEDVDNYRFLLEAAENVGGKLVWLRDGRNPWDIFKKKKFVNHRQSACSKELKITPCREWIAACEFSFSDTTLYFGIGFEEIARLSAISENWLPFKVDAPLCWDDYGWAGRQEINEALAANNLKQPRLYDLGFAHANCGGFCPKAGKKHYKNLLDKLPDVYLHHEQQEQDFLNIINNKKIGLLRDTIKGETYPLTLKDFRIRLKQQSSVDDELLGGCGCFIE